MKVILTVMVVAMFMMVMMGDNTAHRIAMVVIEKL